MLEGKFQPIHGKGGSSASVDSPGWGGAEQDRGLYFRWGKRTLDFVGSVFGLVVFSPLLFMCALLVRLTSRGPIFFRQVRVGRYGRYFEVFKFRTMRVGADRLGAAVVVPGDRRLTPVGNFLRLLKLDELPQLINVLLGDMSFIGPRPRVPELVDLVNPEEGALLSVRPGLSSYASIYHRMEEAYCSQQNNPQAAYRDIQPQKGYLDAEYVKNLSFMLDLKLILLTLLLVIIPGKARPKAVRLFGLRINLYSRTAQMALDLGVFVAAVWLAYWLRFEGQMLDFHRFQMMFFLVLVPAARWATNQAFGIYDMIWRYVSLVDALLLTLSLGAVSAILVSLRLFLPPEVSTTHVFQMPVGVIAIEYFLALGGSLGLRALRRTLYLLDHRYQPLSTPGKRRILILGAGLSGLGIALEIGCYPHLQLLGFIDDDPGKQDCLIAGYRVLGTSKELARLVREEQVSDAIICAGSMPSEALRRIQQECCTQGIKLHVIPTLDQILNSEKVDILPMKTAS